MDEKRGFKKLLAYQRADELASLVYRMSRDVAKTDRWVASQLARAAMSVPANIAEGYGRGSLGDYARFVSIARGSLTELEFHLRFVSREGLAEDAPAARCLSLQEETARLVTGLWQSLKQRTHRPGIRAVDPPLNPRMATLARSTMTTKQSSSNLIPSSSFQVPPGLGGVGR